MTPLERVPRLGDEWGLKNLWVKNETLNLSGSFKDRGAIVAVREAIHAGFKGIMTASSGNAGAAVAAHAARAGLHCTVVADPKAPPEKIRQIRSYGAEIRMVPNLFDQPADAFVEQLQRIAQELDAYLAFFWEPVNPAIIQGFEVIAEEIVDQLGRAPDVVLIPTGGGDHLVAHARAYLRMWRVGQIDYVPQLVAVQPEEACPLVDALQNEWPEVRYRPEPRTIASGLRVAFTGAHALHLMRHPEGTRTPHFARTVSDTEIRTAQALLATREGLWIEPSGAAGIAALPGLVASGDVDAAQVVVAVLTGAGWKD